MHRRVVPCSFERSRRASAFRIIAQSRYCARAPSEKLRSSHASARGEEREVDVNDGYLRTSLLDAHDVYLRENIDRSWKRGARIAVEENRKKK